MSDNQSSRILDEMQGEILQMRKEVDELRKQIEEIKDNLSTIDATATHANMGIVDLTNRVNEIEDKLSKKSDSASNRL